MLLGNCMRQRNSIDRDAIHFVPFTLLPTPFPRHEFERAVHLQPLLQELMFKVTRLFIIQYCGSNYIEFGSGF